MKIYCMSDIHGCLPEFEEALGLIADDLEKDDTKLVLLGDYIHGREEGRGVLDKIMNLQSKYGSDKIIALMGNHEEFVIQGYSTIEDMNPTHDDEKEAEDDDKYIRWMEKLPRYYTEGNTIFVHAGIEEDAGDLWEWCTGDEVFVGKLPAQTGKIEGIDSKVVAGHVGTSKISRNPYYHGIYYDGASHYYIDGTVLVSRRIPVLMVDTDTDKYYRVTKSGKWPIQSYAEENY